eukprot:373221-Hanusia_phi.AAC.1
MDVELGRRWMMWSGTDGMLLRAQLDVSRLLRVEPRRDEIRFADMRVRGERGRGEGRGSFEEGRNEEEVEERREGEDDEGQEEEEEESGSESDRLGGVVLLDPSTTTQTPGYPPTGLALTRNVRLGR